MKRYNSQLSQSRRKKVCKVLFFSFFGFFSLVGMTFSAVFVAMQFDLLNVRGASDARNDFYAALPKNSVISATITKSPTAVSCLQQTDSGEIVPLCLWNQSEEWSVVRAGLTKDAQVIRRVAKETGVPARMIVSAVIPEQLRFFTSSREAYKSYFEPLKILGSMTKFSLGISGIKQETASRIEQYTIDANSPFYPGKGMDKLVAYQNQTNKSGQLYERLTSDDHYYAYLYTALFIKQIQAQWAAKGYDISERPDVVVTLFNIGFDLSKPKATPQIGGASITLNGETYTFGELGVAFYKSDELNTTFKP